MHFGSEKFKYILLSMVESRCDKDKADEILVLLHDIVVTYTMRKIPVGFAEGEIFDFSSDEDDDTASKGLKSKPLYSNKINTADYEDIAEDVFCSVIKGLDKFILNLYKAEYTEQRRQAWLRKIVYCTCARYLNQLGRFDFVIDSEENGLQYIPMSTSKSPEFIAENAEIIQQTIQLVCKAPFKPEKILAYFYNTMIFRVIENRNKNGTSTATYKYMNGRQLYLLKNSFIDKFNTIYMIKISTDDLYALNEILGYNMATEKGTECFQATPKHITDWTSRVKTYVLKHKSNLLGEEESNGKRIWKRKPRVLNRAT